MISVDSNGALFNLGQIKLGQIIGKQLVGAGDFQRAAAAEPGGCPVLPGVARCRPVSPPITEIFRSIQGKL